MAAEGTPSSCQSIAILALAAFGMLAACSPEQGNVEQHKAVLAQLADSRELADLYHWVESNQNSLKHMPCPCGCKGIGHTSNVSCFIQPTKNGKTLYDEHAIGCPDCLNVAKETRSLLGLGKSLKEIRLLIDKKYPGHPTDTPHPHG